MRLLLQEAVKLLSGLSDKDSANNITWISIFTQKVLITRFNQNFTTQILQQKIYIKITRPSVQPFTNSQQNFSHGNTSPYRVNNRAKNYRVRLLSDNNNNNNNNNNNVRLLNYWHTAQLTILSSATQGGTQQPSRRAALYTEGLSRLNCCHTRRTAIESTAPA